MTPAEFLADQLTRARVAGIACIRPEALLTEIAKHAPEAVERVALEWGWHWCECGGEGCRECRAMEADRD